MKVRVVIDGKAYEVEYEPKEENSLTPPGPEQRAQSLVLPTQPVPGSGKSDVDESKVCRSPVAGIVVRIHVEPGRLLRAGDILLVVEAMKMENNLTAAAAVKIKSVKVKVGDAVKVGEILIEFE